MSAEEIEREARRMFRKLAGQAFHLAPAGRDHYALAARGRLMPWRVESRIVAEWKKRGWLSPRGEAADTFALSDAGEGWFLRAQAATEPFAAQHQLRRARTVATAQGERTVLVNDGESTLGWLRKRGLVDGVQHDAGERLRRDFTLGQLSPRLGVDWDKPVVIGGGARNVVISDIAIAARQRFSAALKTVGPGLSDLLYEVCCHLTGLEEAERAKGWPRRSAKVVLQIALDRLAAHYGMRAPERARVRAWRDGE